MDHPASPDNQAHLLDVMRGLTLKTLKRGTFGRFGVNYDVKDGMVLNVETTEIRREPPKRGNEHP